MHALPYDHVTGGGRTTIGANTTNSPGSFAVYNQNKTSYWLPGHQNTRLRLNFGLSEASTKAHFTKGAGLEADFLMEDPECVMVYTNAFKKVACLDIPTNQKHTKDSTSTPYARYEILRFN